MGRTLVNVLIFSVYFLWYDCAVAGVCQNELDPCRCVLNEHMIIDISSLFPNETDNSNSLFLEDTKYNITYYFHGCKDANFKPADYKLPSNNCTQNELGPAALIMYNSSSICTNSTNKIEPLTVIGKSKQIVYNVLIDHPEPYQILFKEGEIIIATIQLVCEHYKTSYIKIIGDPNNPLILLNSPSACVITVNKGLSTGSILILIVIIGLSLYLVGGALLLYYLRGARGIELIPNIDFWKNIPGLVKDGTIFIFSGCSSHYVSAAETYDRI